MVSSPNYVCFSQRDTSPILQDETKLFKQKSKNYLPWLKQVEQCFTRSHEAWAPLPLSKTKEESSKIFTVSKGNQFKVNAAMYKSGGIPRPSKLKYVSGANTKNLLFSESARQRQGWTFGRWNLQSEIFNLHDTWACLHSLYFHPQIWFGTYPQIILSVKQFCCLI